MHIHIATLGESTRPVTKAINAIGGIDKVYLLTGERFKDKAEEVSAMLASMCIEVHTEFVDGFNFQEIVDKINWIYDQENDKKVRFSINITGGTNLMAAAACSCAFFIGATIHYVLWDDTKSISEQVQVVPTPSIPDIGSIKKETLEILMYILEESDSHIITSKEISRRFDVNKQNSYYHLKKLRDSGLITMEKGVAIDGKYDNRLQSIKMTNQGKLVARWLKK